MTQLYALLWLSPLDWSTWLSKDPVNICMHPVRKWHFLCRAVNKTQHLSSVSTVKNKQWLLVEIIIFHVTASTQLLMTMTYTPYRISICIVKVESTSVAAHSASHAGSLALKQAHWFSSLCFFLIRSKLCDGGWEVPVELLVSKAHACNPGAILSITNISGRIRLWVVCCCFGLFVFFFNWAQDPSLSWGSTIYSFPPSKEWANYSFWTNAGYLVSH